MADKPKGFYIRVTYQVTMINEIPPYGLRAYALFFSKHGSREEFRQSELDWIVGQSMKKKIFALLLNSGWIRKISKNLGLKHILPFLYRVHDLPNPEKFRESLGRRAWSLAYRLHMARALARTPEP